MLLRAVQPAVRLPPFNPQPDTTSGVGTVAGLLSNFAQ